MPAPDHHQTLEKKIKKKAETEVSALYKAINY